MITKLVDLFVGIIIDFDRLMFSLSGGLGPWVAPVAPALVYGHTFYENTVLQLGAWAIVGAVAMACGLVVAGAMSSHTAIALKSAGAPADKVRACWGLVVAYIVLEIGGILAMTRFDSIGVVVITGSLLTLVIYLSRSLKYYLDEFKANAAATQVEERADKDMKIGFHLEQARLDAGAKRDAARERLQLDYQVKLAKIEAKKVSSNVSNEVSSNVSNSDAKTRRERVQDALVTTPDMSKSELALQFGVSRQTVYADIKALKKRGLLNGVN